MGGPGSGNWYRWKSKGTTESQKKVDIRWLKRQSYLRSGAIGILSWTRNGEETGSVVFRIKTERMILSYRYRRKGSTWKPVEQIINFDWTACNYGGKRTWFLCPKCSRRVALLYGAGKYFFCRHCYGLNYTTQHEGFTDRMMSRARKIRERLGGDGAVLDFFPSKPKGMHWKTYNRLREKAERAKAAGIGAWAERLGLSSQETGSFETW